VTNIVTPAGATKALSLEAHARELAEHQHVREQAAAPAKGLGRSSIAKALEQAHRHLLSMSSGERTMPQAVEWLIDNYYLIRRVTRQIRKDLPAGFIRHLPVLASGPEAGRLRIDVVAQALVAKTNIELDTAVLYSFVEAYQHVRPLRIAELWALPTLLRTCILHQLVRFLDELQAAIRGAGKLREPPEAEPSAPGSSPDPGVGIERAIRSLRLLDVIDWKAFFERTNRVEAILQADPAQVYEQMDFQTCDTYRRVVETLAWATGRAEEHIAEVAINLAAVASSDARCRHVGYYLVGDGRPLLEQHVGYRATGIARLRRSLTRWPTLSYLGSLALLTIIPLVLLGWGLAQNRVTGGAIAVVSLVVAIPVSGLAVAIIQAIFARLLAPRTLPKLDFTKGLSAEVRTLVVIPTLLGREEDVTSMIRQLELHYLSNPDPQLQFALLTDDIDSKEAPTDALLLDRVAQALKALNLKHAEQGGQPFHLLHRESRWNPREERFMGWERKRGKLDELNRMLRGDTSTSYIRHVGEPQGLSDIRFVITLDSDTQLPIGAAHRLVGTLAHRRSGIGPGTPASRSGCRCRARYPGWFARRAVGPDRRTSGEVAAVHADPGQQRLIAAISICFTNTGVSTAVAASAPAPAVRQWVRRLQR
jgi:cyclic beta-1,2-glucan synthetase